MHIYIYIYICLSVNNIQYGRSYRFLFSALHQYNVVDAMLRKFFNDENFPSAMFISNLHYLILCSFFLLMHLRFSFELIFV